MVAKGGQRTECAAAGQRAGWLTSRLAQCRLVPPGLDLMASDPWRQPCPAFFSQRSQEGATLSSSSTSSPAFQECTSRKGREVYTWVFENKGSNVSAYSTSEQECSVGGFFSWPKCQWPLSIRMDVGDRIHRQERERSLQCASEMQGSAGTPTLLCAHLHRSFPGDVRVAHTRSCLRAGCLTCLRLCGGWWHSHRLLIWAAQKPSS
ncbi:hypothetical protein MRX96_039419 [Rhipicephalus microplus]